MKILYYFAYDGSFMTEWQRIQIFDELSRHNVVFDIFNPNTYSSLEECNEKLVERLQSDHTINVFLNCLGDEYFLSGTMEQISKISIPKVLICFDNLHAPFMHKKIAPYFDLVWLTSWETEDMFKKWGCKTLYMPYAANPYAFKDVYNTQINKACFVGTPYGTRAKTFNSLTNNGVGVDVFCRSLSSENNKNNDIQSLKVEVSRFKVIFELLSFPIGRKVIFSGIKKSICSSAKLIETDLLTILPKVSYVEMNNIYANYALSLNITSLRNTAVLNKPVYKLHLRTFEIPMAYGLELTEYTPEMSKLFAENEVITFKDEEELADKAKYYTDERHETETRVLKQLARRRVENEHTWHCRFKEIFTRIGVTL